jgi:hypothetical protein
VLGQKTGLTGPTFVLKAPTLFSSFAFSSLSADSFSFASLPESGRRPDHTGTSVGALHKNPNQNSRSPVTRTEPLPCSDESFRRVHSSLNTGKLRYVAEGLPQAVSQRA